jgi:hypothetical protein
MAPEALDGTTLLAALESEVGRARITGFGSYWRGNLRDRLTRLRVFPEPRHSQRTYENVNRAVTGPDRGWVPLNDSGPSLAQFTGSKPDDKRPEMPGDRVRARVLIVVVACPKPPRSGTAQKEAV